MEFPALMSPQFNSVEAQTLLTICQKVQIESPAKNRDGSERNFPALKDWKLCENLTPTEATAVDDYWKVWQNTVQPHQYVIALTASDAVADYSADLAMPLVKARISIPDLPEFNLAANGFDDTTVAGVNAGFAIRLNVGVQFNISAIDSHSCQTSHAQFCKRR